MNLKEFKVVVTDRYSWWNDAHQSQRVRDEITEGLNNNIVCLLSVERSKTDTVV